MNKRIFTFILAMLMLTSFLFTGCDAFGGGEESGIEDDITGEASNSAMTLSMYMVSKEPVSEETARAVEDAFNRITKVEFKTQVKLHFATYDEYYETIENVVKSNEEFEDLKDAAEKALKAAKKNAKAEGVVTDDAWFDKFYADNPDYAQFRETEELTGEDTTAEQTELVTIAGIDNTYTLSQLKYPDERQHQIDILWIDSYDRYIEYVEREMIERLDQEITGSSKKLTEYLNGELLTWAKFPTSGTYAIPNNSIIGEYTYLMVNKELAEKYSYNPEELTTLEKCTDFLGDIAKYETSVAPILGDIYPTNTYYWNIDTTTGKINSGTFSILGSTMTGRTHDPSSNANNFLACNNVFKSTEFANQLRCIAKFKEAGYVVKESANPANYAVRIIKGDASLASTYGEDYQLNVLEYPRVGYDDVYSNMLAVSSYTLNLARSMQIITYLNTNSDLRNVLQYGVEGVHYRIDDETGRLVRLNNDYMMDIEATGNVFMAYPEEYMPDDIWEWGKQQNRDALPYLTLGFDFASRLSVPEGEDAAEYKLISVENIDKINARSAEIYKEFEECASLEKFEELLLKWSNLEDEMPELKVEKSSAAFDPENPTRVPNPGFYHYYYQWLQDSNLYVVVEE